MKKANYRHLATIALTSFLAVGCAKKDDNSDQSAPGINQNKEETSKATDTETYQPKCQKAEIFSTMEGIAIDQEDLLQSFSGEYELDQVHVHHTVKSLDDKYVGAFYGVVTRYIGNHTYASATSIRETDVTYKCNDHNENSEIPFLSGVHVLVAATVHTPSGRITVFDQDSQLDNPQFNLPLLSEVQFNSLGSAHYKNTAGISGPPYLSHRYLSDVIERYANAPKIYMRSNGGFEIRVSWNEQTDLDEGKSFKTETDVVITYKRYE